jgi:hypothetical protein
MNTAYQIDRNRWAKFTLFEQMGNIGSEVGRTFSAGRKQDSDAVFKAVIRTLDLFAATAELVAKSSSSRTKEVLRAKDQYLQIVLSKTFNSVEAQQIERYFMEFARATRSQR